MYEKDYGMQMMGDCMGTDNVMAPSLEVLRLMPPNVGFLSAELLAIAKKHDSDVFINIGSCNKLMSVVSDVGSAPISMTSQKVRKSPKRSMTGYLRTEWKYTLRSKGSRLLKNGEIIPVWR